ncbi:hypothetical protein B0A48_18626 [Cryoendolithus antarcticus]|uniref:Uncharacterized protein n=1 Tax=Cryoendolithus antarcticus TaxID=1507870 RepID=A0A1V8S835_9PEZI|nr:hypothetical protein B0A48_18626 [Cryoendolithus antarcticus]
MASLRHNGRTHIGISGVEYLCTIDQFPSQFAIKGDEDTMQQREFESQLQQRFREQLVGAVGPNRRTTSTELLDNDEETAPLKGDTQDTITSDQAERRRILKELDQGHERFGTEFKKHPKMVYSTITNLRFT